MFASLYLTSAEGRSGKSAVALGVLDSMLADAPRVGVFRPVIRSRTERDRVLELLRTRATAEVPYEECIGVTYEDVDEDAEAALLQIVSAYQRMRRSCDAILVVGSDFTDVAVPTELSFNARIAANLDAPAMLIVGGRQLDAPESLGQTSSRTPEELARVAHLGMQELEGAHASVIAVLVNRADPDALEDITRAVQERLRNETPVWVLPEQIELVAPPVSAIIDAVDGTFERGGEALLEREVRSILVAGMSMPNVLPRLTEAAAVVVAADRAETLLAVVMAHEAPTFPSIAAVVLNGDLELTPDVELLLDGIDSKLPIIRTRLGTFETARLMTAARGLIGAETPARLDLVTGLFRENVDAAVLRERMALYPGGVRTPTMFRYELFQRAAESGARIVLPEGNDDRILRAAARLQALGTAHLVILGDEEEVRAGAARLGLDISGAEVIDPLTSELRDECVAELFALREHRGLTRDAATDQVSDATMFGTLMVQLGYADGMVSGAAHTTAHTIRPALQVIKTEPGVSVVSSVFFMLLDDRVLVYGDCAVNPEPTAEELADIALSSADTAARFGVEPRVAMLSYATGDSGSGAEVEKVRHATELARAARPGLLIDGPIQYDAASDPMVSAAKLPGSEVAGRATVFIFPDLNTGNNTYKAVQRSTNSIAVGPVLQGLNKPVNDLSRGATVEDIINTVAITAIQAGN